MAIVNNPHNIQDIDKEHKAWAKLAKQKGILISINNTWFNSKSAYFAGEWLADSTDPDSEDDPVVGKAARKKNELANNLISTHFTNRTIDFTNDSSFTKVFIKNDDRNYYFQFHYYTVDELIKPSNTDGGLLYNNGLFELRILDGDSPSANIVDTIKVCCNDNSSGFRNNDRDNEVLPGKFVICYIKPNGEKGTVTSDVIYPLDTLYYFVGYGLLGDFINVASNSKYVASQTDDIGIPKFLSLVNDFSAADTSGAAMLNFTSTSLVKVPKDTGASSYDAADYYFDDRSKQRNGLNVAANRAVDYVRNVWFTADEIPTLKVFDLFTNFKLNTEFMIDIVGPFHYEGSDLRLVENDITGINMRTFRFDNCKTVKNLFSGMKKLTTIQTLNS